MDCMVFEMAWQNRVHQYDATAFFNKTHLKCHFIFFVEIFHATDENVRGWPGCHTG